jgi:hypothetical protein
MQRAGLFQGTPGAVDDVRSAVAAVETLVRDDPLPWRLDEARDIRERAEALVTEWDAATADDSPEPAEATGRRVTWLDPGSAAEGVPLLVFNPLLRFGTRLPRAVPWSGPTLSVADAELLGVWGDEAWGAGLVVGLSELQSADDVAAGLAAGRPPNPLPGTQEWVAETGERPGAAAMREPARRARHATSRPTVPSAWSISTPRSRT